MAPVSSCAGGAGIGVGLILFLEEYRSRENTQGFGATGLLGFIHGNGIVSQPILLYKRLQ